MLIKDKGEIKALLDRMEKGAKSPDEKRSRIKGILYGPKGGGKTILAVRTAKRLLKGTGKKIIFVDNTEGWESLKNHPDLLEGVEIKVVDFESIEQLSVLAGAIFFEETELFTNVGAIIFDDANRMAEKQLNRLWATRVEKGSTLDPDKPERPEYLKLQIQFMEVVNDIITKTPDIHIFLTSHASEKKSADGQVIIKTFPGFNPALSEALGGSMNIVAYMKAKEKDRNNPVYERIVQVHPTSTIDAKTRVGFPTVRVTDNEFVKHVVAWSESGGNEESENAAVKRDIETMKTSTDDDILSLSEDDTPAFVG
jgi:hypothetical protein